MRNRNIQVIVRFNKDEHQRLKKLVKRSGVSQEVYIRHLIEGVVPADMPPPDYFSMMNELRRIGGNLNQIAQKVHVLNVVDAARYDEVVKALDRALLKITNAVMLPRKITGSPQSPQALWGEEQPRSGESFASQSKNDKRGVL